MVLRGKTPASIHPFFFGASLMALTKKEGGIRPIAVGCTLCRLAAKVAGFRARDKMAALLAPRQLGYSVRGCSKTLHAGLTVPVRPEVGLQERLRHETKCFRRCRTLHQIYSRLSTHHPPPSSGTTKSSSLRKGCNRASPSWHIISESSTNLAASVRRYNH